MLAPPPAAAPPAGAASPAGFEAAARAIKNGLAVPLRRLILEHAPGLAAATDAEGRGLLHWAAYYSRASLMRELLASGAGVTVHALGGSNHESALHVAARKGALAIAKVRSPGRGRCRGPGPCGGSLGRAEFSPRVGI